MITMSPNVATTSERKWPALARWCVEMLTAARENMRLATTAPNEHPATWEKRYAVALRQVIPPKAASTKETTGLKCAPDTGPTMRIRAKSPVAVAAAFSSSSRPVLPGESRWAAMPDPTTTAARNAEPMNSAVRRRQRAFSDMGVRRVGVPTGSQQHADGPAAFPEVPDTPIGR